MPNVREFLKWRVGYETINREERNLAAILYHALLLRDNLERFLRAAGICPPMDRKDT